MKKIKLRELSPVIVSIFILIITIIGLANAVVTNNGSIGGLFDIKDSIGWDYNSQTGTIRGYRLDAKNIFPANFGGNNIKTTGTGTFKTIISGTGTFVGDLNALNNLIITSGYIDAVSLFLNGKATNSTLTSSGDSSKTLTTKSYIDNKIGSTSHFECQQGKYLQGFDLKTGVVICVVGTSPDTIPPVLSSTTQIFTTTVGTALTLATVTANDAVDGAITVIQGGVTPNFNTIGSYDVTYSATDVAGNTSTIIHTYVVGTPPDTIPPVLSSTTQIFTTTVGTALILATVTANDAVDGAITVIQGGVTPNFNTIGSYDVTYSATDVAGNTSIITHTYIVVGFTCGTDTVSAGGETYTTILGPYGKCWTSQNMRHGTMLANGATMPSNPNVIEKWCYNNDPNMCITGGGLYTWAEAKGFSPYCNTSLCSMPEDTTKSVCGQLGAGWQLSIRDPWMNLNLKSSAGWSGSKLSGVISSLPGVRSSGNSFLEYNTMGVRWLSNPSSNTYAWFNVLGTTFSNVLIRDYFKNSGYSVVCTKN